MKTHELIIKFGGFGEVSALIHETKKFRREYVLVSFAGNMRTGLEDVARRFDNVYGDGKFQLLRDAAIEEDGYPDYAWGMKLNKTDWNEIVVK